jgi:hypothetical protein
MNFDRTLNLCNRVILISLFLFSCKKADLPGTAANNAAGDDTSTSSVYQETTSPQQRLLDCSVDCINPQGPFVECSAFTTSSWGGPNLNMHTKTVSYVAYNTATDFVVKVTYVKSGQNSNASNLIAVNANGTIQSVATLASGGTATFNFPLPAGWASCNSVPFTIRQEGQGAAIMMSSNYKLFPVCALRCATSFTGEAVTCGTQREAVYRFTAESDMSYIKIQGGLTNFTGADAEVTITGGNLSSSQSTPGGSSNRVIKVEGSVNACDQVEIRIRWSSTNTGGIITGDWSVKDANGVEVAPSVAGLQCQ